MLKKETRFSTTLLKILKTIAREKARLDDHINQYKTKFAQIIFEQFNEEIKQLQDSLKNGNYFDASTHSITANWLIRNSKKGDFD